MPAFQVCPKKRIRVLWLFFKSNPLAALLWGIKNVIARFSSLNKWFF